MINWRNKDNKIFCIGNNKTGTTSLEKFFKDHNYNVANQREAELLMDDYIDRNWKPIIKYTKKYEVFQDVPFSNKYTYAIMHATYPNAKFILSVRDTAEQWYNSISKFHGKLFGQSGKLASKTDLQNGLYIEKGWIWKTFIEKFGDYDDPYNKERLINYYHAYNQEVEHYFKNNPNFIKINIADDFALEKLSNFLAIKPKYDKFPHENITNI